ncbi:hypothetical protein LTR10_010924 [Elasticomyces elasticus]|nr:hypothetical protein LTR10_010924 [Elasticomyces elasticus]KAK4968529.1 hypothetical protein LTR42_009812 [Elasticomyces elasticus]
MDQHWSLPARVLCLDGGGVRGLSSLMILETVMNQIADDEKAEVDTLRPCDYFDLICGTSTGGLIAILLGRLRLTVRDAIKAYVTLSEQIFKDDRSVSIFKTGLRGSKGGESRFDAEILKNCVRDLVAKHCDNNPDARLHDPAVTVTERGDRPCHVAVLAVFSDGLDKPHLFKSYDRNETCTIWEAARATSAAPTFFDPIDIGLPPVRYLDAGLGFNNPAEVVFDEVRERWPGRRIGVFLSLGTGKETGIALTREASHFGFRKQADLVGAMMKLTTSAARTHDQMWKKFSRTGDRGSQVYFRFNVDGGFEKVGLQEWKRIGEMAGQTKAYLSGAQIQDENKTCAASIRRLSHRSKPFELSSKVFVPNHESEPDTDFRSMQYWYREPLCENGFPAGVQVDDIFIDGKTKPVGSEILSLRRVCNLMLRAEALGIVPGKYRVVWIFWFWAGRDHPLTSVGLNECFSPKPDSTENSVYQRTFPPIKPNLQAPQPDSGFFHPWDLKLEVGRAKSSQNFMELGVDRNKHPIVAEHLLQPATHQQQVIDAGLWGTMKNTGWAEAKDIIVEVQADGYLAFLISLDWNNHPRWYGGMSFGGVRLEPVCE